jgi:hypothetical protein
MAYGIQMRNADGSLVLEGQQTLPRRVFRKKIQWNSAVGRLGTFPDFDDTRGALALSPGAFRYIDSYIEGTGHVKRRVGEGEGFPRGAIYGYNPISMPTVHWDNDTKELSLLNPIPSYGGFISDWWAFGVHYK